jgi:hypothetical protein
VTEVLDTADRLGSNGAGVNEKKRILEQIATRIDMIRTLNADVDKLEAELRALDGGDGTPRETLRASLDENRRHIARRPDIWELASQAEAEVAQWSPAKVRAADEALVTKGRRRWR